MKRKSFLYKCFIYFVLIILFSCGGKKDLKKNQLLELEIEYSLAKMGLNFSDLIKDSVEIIPLSSKLNDDEYFFISTISKILFEDDKIFVLDNFNDSRIRVFNYSGDLISTIGELGDGLGEYLQPMDFILTENGIEVLDVGRIHKYKNDGTYLESKKYIGFTASSFEKLSNGYAFVSSGPDEKNLHLTDTDFNIVSSHFPYHTRAINALILNPFITTSDNEIIYRRNQVDTLFKIDNLQNPEPYLRIQYGSKAPKIYDWLGLREDEIQFEMTKSSNTLNFFESKNYRFLSFFLDNEKWNYVYSNQTKKSFTFKSTELIDDLTFNPYSYLIGVSGETFYFLSNPQMILLNYSENLLENQSDEYKEKIKSTMEMIEKEGNPVLFGVKFNF